MKKPEKGTWLTGKYTFIQEPEDGKWYLAMEWLWFVGDEDKPKNRFLWLEEAFES